MESKNYSCIKKNLLHIAIGFIFSSSWICAAEKNQPTRTESGLTVALRGSIESSAGMSCESESEFLRRSGTVFCNLETRTNEAEYDFESDEENTQEELDGAKACFAAIADDNYTELADLLQKYPLTQVNKFYDNGEKKKTLRDAALELPFIYLNKNMILKILDTRDLT